MNQNLDRFISRNREQRDVHHPPSRANSFELLSVVLDCNWSFQQHFLAMSVKAAKRLRVLPEVGNPVRGMEARISSVTTLAMLWGVVCFWLPTTGAHVNLAEMRKQNLGTDITARVETTSALVDIRRAFNHYVLQNANTPNRDPRARGTAAQKKCEMKVR